PHHLQLPSFPTRRSSDLGMLSTVQDFRKGQASQQHHVWQATLSPEAQVFTTHPRTPTEPGVPWHSNSEDWTGNASLPRSAQLGRSEEHTSELQSRSDLVC